jgi:hypothetical protein
VYELQDGVCFRVNVHTEDSSGISAESKQFHITDSQQLIGNRSFKVKLITDDVIIPSNAINRGDMMLNTSCISAAAQEEQKDSLANTDLGKLEYLRGVYCDYNRILGLPFWHTGKDTWGFQRNASGFRSVLSFKSQWVAENIVSILCEKQRTNLTNAHPVLKKLFDAVIKNINKNYTDSKPGRTTTTTGVKTWNLNKLYSQITNTPLAQPAPTITTVAAPIVAQGLPRPRRATSSIVDDSSSVSDASSITSMESASSSDNDTSTRLITFDLAIRELIVMNAGREVARFNNYGNGSGLRDWLKAVYDTKSDEDFIRYIYVFKNISATHNV